MNKRRWIAVVIAVGLFLFSAVSSRVATHNNEETKEALAGLNALLYGSNQLEKKVLEDGNETQQIAKLSVDGTIADTGSGGIFSTESYSHQDFLAQLKEIQTDENIKAILLEVNSPGGGVYESAEIAKEFAKIKKLKIPVYVSMKNMAASGGYYISAAADKIFATDETVTGSIGVIMSGVNYSGLMEKLGITDQTYKSGALKDMGSATRKPTEKDKEVLQTYVNNAYNRFVEVVANGRHMSEDAVRKIADGRIYDGAQAKNIGLVDEIGFPEDTLAALKKDQKLTDAQVIEYTVGDTGFYSSWLGSKVAQWQGLAPTESSKVLHLFESLGSAQAPKPLYYYGGE